MSIRSNVSHNSYLLGEVDTAGGNNARFMERDHRVSAVAASVKYTANLRRDPFSRRSFDDIVTIV